MKPNLLVIQSDKIQADEVVEQFCEKFCDTHYVYLIRPFSEFRDDSPSGIRFLNNPLDQLPGFAEVDAAIAVGEPEIVETLKKTYPESKSVLWDIERHGFHADPLEDKPSIVRGNFSRGQDRELADAV